MKGSIRWGEVIETSNDKGPYKIVKAKSDGKEMDVTVAEPYGVQGAPLKNSKALIFVPDDDAGKAVAIVMPPPKDRVDGQAEGEVTFKNHAAGQAIKMDKDGTVTIKADKIVLDCSEILLGSAGASRELALKDTVTTDGAKNISNLSVKVKAE